MLSYEEQAFLRAFSLSVPVDISMIWASPVPTLGYIEGKKKAKELTAMSSLKFRGPYLIHLLLLTFSLLIFAFSIMSRIFSCPEQEE